MEREIIDRLMLIVDEGLGQHETVAVVGDHLRGAMLGDMSEGHMRPGELNQLAEEMLTAAFSTLGDGE